jgi:undecaprenyl-diphosphatase
MSKASTALRRLVRSVEQHASATLMLVLLAGLGLWAFVEVADEVTEGESQAFDRAVFMALRDAEGQARGPNWIGEFMRDITALGSTGVLAGLVLLVAGYLWLDRRRPVAIFVVASTTTGALVSFALKAIFARPRPDLVTPAVEVFSKSFPSGHSAMSAMVYLTLGVLLSRVQDTRATKLFLLASAGVITLLVGTSRAFLGVHWPTDVAAGWALGSAWAAASWLVFDRWDRHTGRDLDAPEE